MFLATEERSQETVDWDRLLEVSSISTEIMKGGKNNRLFKINCPDGRVFAGKHYFSHPSDLRDRMGTELLAYEILLGHGVDCIPRLVAKDLSCRAAVFEFIEGTPVHDTTTEDIQQAADFLCTLKDVAETIEPHTMGPASEACFSPQGVVDNLQTRLHNFDDISYDVPYGRQLRGFLEEVFAPALHDSVKNCRTVLARANLSFSREIGWSERTLSPSDFGFHNALRCRGSSVVFLDFEYFGWDDPVKTLCDISLHPHPAMRSGEELIELLTGTFLQKVNPYGSVHDRIRALFPLFGLKWCLILLNEFIPTEWARRRFAGMDEGERKTVLGRQLEMAKQFLEESAVKYENFCSLLA